MTRFERQPPRCLSNKPPFDVKPSEAAFLGRLRIEILYKPVHYLRAANPAHQMELMSVV